jgi:transcription initiation factor TFIID subunit 7
MQPGEDCDYLRDAINTGRIGLPQTDGGADVSIRFIDKDLKRAVVKVRRNTYAAVLVELPCIVETMKSWDKKGWWKVADMCQMLLVLGSCTTDDEAKNYPLPREVDKDTLLYPHGLTPPMHWVRKRRFRKRLSHKTVANVEEEVERLLREDLQAEKEGGSVAFEITDPYQRERAERGYEEYGDEDDALETTENGQQEEYFDDEDDNADLEGNLQAMFDEEDQATSAITPAASNLLTDFAAPLADQAASFTAAGNTLTAEPESVAATPAEITQTEDEGDEGADEEDSSSDDDASDDEADSPDVMDEDAAAKAAERNQQLEEVADLEREIANQRVKYDGITNQLLKQRAGAQLRTLEEDLRRKREVFGLVGEDGDGEGEGGGV